MEHRLDVSSPGGRSFEASCSRPRRFYQSFSFRFYTIYFTFHAIYSRTNSIMRDGWYSIVKSPVIKQRKNNWNSSKRIFYTYKRAYFPFFSLFFLFTILTDWPALLKSRPRLKLVQSLKFHVYSLMLARWTRYVAGNDAPLGRTWLESAIVSIIRSPPDKFMPRLYPESNFCLRFQFSRSCAFSLRLVETGRKKASRPRKFNVSPRFMRSEIRYLWASG